jgi:hypothetical protein
MKSHTVPQRLLRQFSYDDPITKSLRLWKYTKGLPPSPKASPRTATRIEGHFASPTDSALERLVETRLAIEIEDPVNRFIANFSDPLWTMTESQRRQMTRYIALLLNRCVAKRAATTHQQAVTAYALEKFLGNRGQLLTVAAHWTIKALDRGQHFVFTPEDVARATRRQLIFSQTEAARQEGFAHSVVSAMALFDDLMFSGDWNIVRTVPDNPFILSDTPVVTWERIGPGVLAYGMGFHRPNVEIVLPVSPVSCLHLLPQVERERPRVVPTTQEINEAQASFSYQSCFANQNKKEIDEIVQRCGQTVQLGRNAFMLWHRNFDNLFFDCLMQQT